MSFFLYLLLNKIVFIRILHKYLANIQGVFILDLLFFTISFLASIIGTICGIGGGIIIKPVLDATGIMTISSINFLSGCTALTISLVSMLRSLKYKNKEIVFSISTPLAVGASIGGILGKEIFQYILINFSDKNKVISFQAIILIAITIGTLLYSIYTPMIKTLRVTNPLACGIIGLILGLFSSLLGIGGGPINIAVLQFFFSMETKISSKNSLYIIMFSQFFGLTTTIINGYIPEFKITILLLMILGGFFGGLLGNKINKHISSRNVNKLLIIVMISIILINLNNIAISL